MKRFIFLTFGFLTLAFYQLSGGAGFDPVEAREMAVLARIDTEKSYDAQMRTSAAKPVPDTSGTVTRAALDLVSFDVAAGESDAAQPQDSQKDVAQIAEAAGVKAAPVDDSANVEPVFASITSPVNQVALSGVPVGDGSNQITFAGLSNAASSQNVERTTDIRSVTGTLVNVRSGPGTEFPVVNQLERGARIEVIGDNGSGWVELRPVEGGPSGWMADFLLSSG